jgi:hypothetical protein
MNSIDNNYMMNQQSPPKKTYDFLHKRNGHLPASTVPAPSVHRRGRRIYSIQFATPLLAAAAARTHLLSILSGSQAAATSFLQPNALSTASLQPSKCIEGVQPAPVSAVGPFGDTPASTQKTEPERRT